MAAALVWAASRSAVRATVIRELIRCSSAVAASSTSPFTKEGSTSAERAKALAARVMGSLPSRVWNPVMTGADTSTSPSSTSPMPYQG